MSRCPITYEPLKKNQRYSRKGLRMMSPTLTRLKDFGFSAVEQRKEAQSLASKLSIQGVQPKLSVKLSVKKAMFEIVDRGGRFIFKPQIEHYLYVPENEDLTMRLARIVGIEVPDHGLVYCKDGSLTYFIRRFDRIGQKSKVHVEDFAQLSGENRYTKYDSSMEKVAKIIESFCTFPLLEKRKLFERTLFSFLVGNEDMHLKNFSLIVRSEKVELSPAYDLLNSTLVMGKTKEEMALPINGRKNKISREDLFDAYATKTLGLSSAIVREIVSRFETSLPTWSEMVKNSFLPKKLQADYQKILLQRAQRIGFKV